MPALQYTKASLLLAGVPDSYDAEAAKERWAAANSAAARDQRASNDPSIGVVYQVATTVVNTVVNIIAQVPIAQLLWMLADYIGNAVTRMSSGGFDKLPVLARQRLGLEMPGWGNKKPTLYKSQSFTGPVETFGVLKKPELVYTSEAEFRRTLRNYLIAEAQAQEFNRITKTADEPILPDVVIGALNAHGLYPPPIQPMPLTRQGWQSAYPGYSAWYTYNPPKLDGGSDLQYRGLQGISPATQAALAQEVGAQLQADYADDAKLYSGQLATLELVMPPDLLALISQTQMAPRYGSLANPVMATSRRHGVN